VNITVIELCIEQILYKGWDVGHNDALPHRESNQGFAPFRLLALRFCAIVLCCKFVTFIHSFETW